MNRFDQQGMISERQRRIDDLDSKMEQPTRIRQELRHDPLAVLASVERVSDIYHEINSLQSILLVLERSGDNATEAVRGLSNLIDQPYVDNAHVAQALKEVAITSADNT